MKQYTIDVVQTTQKHPTDHQIFVGKIKMKDVLEKGSVDRDARFKIHKWSHDQAAGLKGYQRAPDPTRIGKIKNYLQGEVENPIFPTAILVSARQPLKFRSYEGKNKDFGELIVDQTLFVIDGQHRIEAFKDIADKDELSSLYGYIEIPIIILSGFKYKEEVEQFFVINDRQKGVKADLAQRIYVEIAKNDDGTRIVRENKKWQLPAVTVVDELNKDERSIWYRLIALPDDDKDIKKERVITQNSFIKSLQPFFIGQFKHWEYASGEKKSNGHKIVEDCKKLIDSYWKMVETVYPDAFDDKKNYALFKTTGVFSLHTLLAMCLSDHPELKQDEIIKKLKGLLEVARDDNKLNINFWKVSSGPASGLSAGMYSNSAGHNRIALSILNKKDIRDF